MRALLEMLPPWGNWLRSRLRGQRRAGPHPPLRGYFPQGGKILGLALASVFLIAAASDPSERLPDPAQEARARELFQEIRCLVCQNESIDDSEAELAGDLRRIVREQVAAGRSDEEVRDFLVARYGEFVLLKPPFNTGNLILWIAPFVVAVLGGLLLFSLTRRRATAEALSAEEEKRLNDLLEPDDD